MSKSKVTFRIGASLHHNPAGVMPDAAVVTKALGIEPSRSHNAGEPNGPRVPPWKHGQWALVSPLSEQEELEAHLTWLLDRLLPISDRVHALATSDPRLKFDFYCGLWFHDGNAGVELSPETLQGIAALGATLELDIYDLPDADPAR